MGKGWIALNRSIQDCFIWSDKPYAKGQAWIDMLLLANHSQKKLLSKSEVVTVDRGSFLTSDNLLAERWGWGRKKVRTFIDMLENESMIVTKRNSKGTIVSIVKYAYYQDGGNQEEHQENIKGTSKEHQRNIKGTSKEHQRNTNNNDNNINNDNNVNNENKETNNKANAKRSADTVYYPNDEILNKTFGEYVLMRKKIKSPMTDRAIELAMKKLDNLSGGDNDKAIKILEQSIMNSWKGLFELKEEQRNSNKNNQGYDWDNI